MEFSTSSITRNGYRLPLLSLADAILAGINWVIGAPLIKFFDQLRIYAPGYMNGVVIIPAKMAIQNSDFTGLK
jgi:hypothetical protein